MISLRRILITALLAGCMAAGVTMAQTTPQSVTYYEDTNRLEIEFDDQVRASDTEILFNRLTLTDGITSYTLTGGTVLNQAETASTLDISLLYDGIAGSYVYVTPGFTRETRYCWGKVTGNVEAVDELGDNLQLVIGNGCFLDEDYNTIQGGTLDVDVMNSSLDNRLVSVAYNAETNIMRLEFNTVIQFDENAEDIASDIPGAPGDPIDPSWKGPGNGQLDNNVEEDQNLNGVLDMESNVRLNKLAFYDDEGGEFLLEEAIGTRGLTITDNSVLEFQFGRVAASKIELLEQPMQLRLDLYAFIDQDYNPVTPEEGLVVDFTPETMLLELESATYTLDENYLVAWFNQSLDSDSLLGHYLSLSKISIGMDDNMRALESAQSTFEGAEFTGLKITLEIPDAKFLEELVEAYPDSEFTVAMERNAVFSQAANHNIATSTSITIIEEDPEYRYPPPKVVDASYDAALNLLTVNFENRIDSYAIPEGFALVMGENSYTLSENCEYDRGAGNTGIEIQLTPDDYVAVETDPGRTSATLDIASYSVFSQLSQNGNPAVTDQVLEYIADADPPLPTSIWYGSWKGVLRLGFTKIIDPSLVDFTRITLEGVTLTEPDSVARETDGTVTAWLNATDVVLLNQVSDADKVGAEVALGDNFLTNNDGAFTVEVTGVRDSTVLYSPTNPDDSVAVMVGMGRQFYAISFASFPTPPALTPASVRAVTDHAVWYVANDQWIAYAGNNGEVPLKRFELEAAIEHFEGSGDNPGTFQKVADLLVGDNIDEIPKICFALLDINDEFGIEDQEGDEALWKHGYFNPDDNRPSTGEDDPVNEMDVVFVDTHPQNFDSTEVSHWQDDDGGWNESSEEVNYGLQAVTNMCAEYIAYLLDPFEEEWIRIGLTYLSEFMADGQPQFYGEGPTDGLRGGNDLINIPDQFNSGTNIELMTNKDDYKHAYMFFLYLWEKYGSDDLIREIANSRRVGAEGIELVIEANMPTLDSFLQERWSGTEDILKGIYLDFATANLIDTTYGDDGGIFQFDNLFTRSSARGTKLKWINEAKPPYSGTGIEWGFNYFYSIYSIPEDNTLISDPHTESVYFFAGEDAEGIQVRKLNSMGDDPDMGDMYFIQDFELDILNSGLVPMSVADQGWLFGPDENADSTEFKVWSLIVMGADEDFTITNRSAPVNYVELFVAQSPVVKSKLDLYAISALPIYNEQHEEAPIIYSSSTEDGSDTLQFFSNMDDYAVTVMDNDGSPFTIYQNSIWADGEGTIYWFLDGYYDNGERVEAGSVGIGLNKLPAGRAGMLELGDVFRMRTTSRALDETVWAAVISIPDQAPNGMESVFYERTVRYGTDQREAVSPIFRVTPAELEFDDPVSVTIKYDADLAAGSPVGIYRLHQGEWVYIGGAVNADDNSITARITKTGSFRVLSGETGETPAEWIIPEEYVLHQNYPNPFNPSTVIPFEVPRTGPVSLVIYDILGRQVTSLLDSDLRYGIHRVAWSGMDEGGGQVASGVYFLQMKAGSFSSVKKMVIVH